MHGILESVTAQPVKAEMVKCVYPAMGERSSLEGTLDSFCALWVFLPISDAVAARVPVGIDIDCNSEQVI